MIDENDEASALSFICEQLEEQFNENHFQIPLGSVDGDGELKFLSGLKRITNWLKESYRRNSQNQNKAYIKNLYQISLKYLRQSQSCPEHAIRKLQETFQCQRNQISSGMEFSAEDEATYDCVKKSSYTEVDRSCFRFQKGQQLTLQEWKRVIENLSKLRHEMIRCVLPHKRLEDRKTVCHKIDGFQMLFERVRRVYQIFKKCSHEENLLNSIEEIYVSLIQNSFIVVKFPKSGCIKRKTGGAAGTKVSVTLRCLLPLKSFHLSEKDFVIESRYLNEKCFVDWRSNRMDLAGLPPIQAKWKIAGLGNVEFEAQDLKLCDKTVGSHPAQTNNNERVTHRKGVFIFYCDIPFSKLDVSKGGACRIITVSDSVVPIVHSNQECDAEGTLFVDSLVAWQNVPRQSLTSHVDEVDVNTVIQSISQYLSAFTSKGLFLRWQEEYFRNRLISECGCPNLTGCVSLQRLTSTNFWKWFWNCCQLFTDKDRNLHILRTMWTDGLIIGFISELTARMICSQTSYGAFAIRFSESNFRQLCVQLKKDKWEPFKEDELKTKCLAEILLEFCPQKLIFFAHLGESVGKCEEVLPKYCPEKKFGDGYVKRGHVSTELHDLFYDDTTDVSCDLQSLEFNELNEDENDFPDISLLDNDDPMDIVLQRI